MTGDHPHRKNGKNTEPKTSGIGGLLDGLMPVRVTARKLSEELARMEAFSRAVPMEYCGWDQSGAQAVSGGFCFLLDIDRVQSFADVKAALPTDDGNMLESLYDSLRHDGAHFETAVHTLRGRKTLKFFGKRGAVSSGTQVFSVLWALDISEFAEATRRAGDAIARSEQRENDLRQALNSLDLPLWFRNENLDISWCNKAYARRLDDTAASVVADQKEMPLKDAQSPGVLKGQITPRLLAQRALSAQEAQKMRGHMIVDGKRKLLDVTETPVGQTRKIAGFATDITREEELQDAYERLAASHRESLEQLRTAIAMFDADQRMEFYNPAYQQLTGLSETWLDAKPKFVEIIDKMRESRRLPEQSDYKQFKQQWLARFTSLLEPYEEMQYLPDGTITRLIAVPRPMGGLLLTMEDVTSRLQLETSYNTLMAVRQETLDNLSEALAVFGEDGKLRLSNQAFSALWRLPPGISAANPHISAILESFKGFFGPETWEKTRNIFLGNALERESRKGRIERADGSIIEFSVTPLPDGNILNTWLDVTNTVRVEQALMEKNAALEEAERLKSDFLANVSYQLRTPLNAIMGFTEMLNRQYFGPLNERQLEYTTNMIEAGQRLVSLINDILDLSTIEAGYLKLYPGEVRMRALIEQVVHLTQEWARKQGIEMFIQCPDEILILADERRIKQVLLNLISNAINYSPNGGLLTITGAIDDGFVNISVRDTGLGIPAEDLDRVFTPFERIKSKTAGRRGGAGLGLSLVKSIVQMHGGTVSIESKEGAGTTVHCRLPLYTPA